jgi:hypothetical protein
MTTRVYVAKYVPDPARWEPRNVGVIVVDGTERAARFLAEEPTGKIEGRQVRYAVGAPAEVYREWVHYWRRVVIREGTDPAELSTSDASTFFVHEAGEILADTEPRPIDVMVSDYFKRLVAHEDRQEVELKEAVEQLLRATKLDETLQRDVEVSGRPANTRERPERFRFEYGRRNGHLIVGHRVPLQMDAFVHDALYRYGRLPSDVVPVSFVQGFDREGDKPAVRNLEVWSTVVDVLSADAPAEVERAFEVGARG